MDEASLERLARDRGIGEAYHDFRGQLRYFSAQTKSGILRAMGALGADGVARPSERQLLPPVAASNSHRIGVDVWIGAAGLGGTLQWTLVCEDGARHQGSLACTDCAELRSEELAGQRFSERRLELPLDLPAGYHDLEASVDGGARARCRLIIAPDQCYQPAEVLSGRRLWGVAVQLYTLRSERNWGIGDFADLAQLIRWLGPLGAGFVGLNPLHALFPAAPDAASPYSASNRHFLNVLYIAVPEVSEYATCAAARRKVDSKGFAARLATARASGEVDYREVAALKLKILELLYQEFRQRHLERATPRAALFRAFVAAGGELLERQARFDALDQYLCGKQRGPHGWRNWPGGFRDPESAASLEFAATNQSRIEFQQYLQWLADTQLREVKALARTLGMPIGLYGDYAVGANVAGGEIWSDRSCYRLEAEIGAPPDPLALKGQAWGVPPQDPRCLQEGRLQGFIELVRHNMRYYGAMRFDHVMSLFRLWWIPQGLAATAGAYVHYPLHQLFAIVALESQRNRCLIVGEDLGVVPDEVRAVMPRYGLYHYKVMLFEKEGARFRRPAEYARWSLATVTTHDLPTFRSFWSGEDIALRERLQLYPSEEVRDRILAERAADREALGAALREEGLAPPQAAGAGLAYSADLVQAIHLYLARCGAVLVALQLEDLLGMIAPVNVPGTSDEYPNWRRKMSETLEQIAARADLQAALGAIGRARAGPAPPGTKPDR